MKLIQKMFFVLLIGVAFMSQSGRFLLNSAQADNGKLVKKGGPHPHPRDGSGGSCA